jgi:hypothetical protein
MYEAIALMSDVRMQRRCPLVGRESSMTDDSHVRASAHCAGLPPLVT